MLGSDRRENEFYAKRLSDSFSRLHRTLEALPDFLKENPTQGIVEVQKHKQLNQYNMDNSAKSPVENAKELTASQLMDQAIERLQMLEAQTFKLKYEVGTLIGEKHEGAINMVEPPNVENAIRNYGIGEALQQINVAIDKTRSMVDECRDKLAYNFDVNI